MGAARYASYVEFQLLYVDTVNYWWGSHAHMEPTECWMHMMGEVVAAAIESAPCNPTKYGLFAAPGSERGLWLEFGVGSGKTTAVIAVRMKHLLGEDVAILHGFDSFEGLPETWD